MIRSRAVAAGGAVLGPLAGNPWVEAWFAEGADDPNVVLIKFSSDSAEYWDTPGGRLATVISLLKSKVTGERYDGGENAKIDL